MFLSSVVPVWMPKWVTWNWTVGNKISPLPSSASPHHPPTRLTRASPHRLPPSPASCATLGPPPTPRTPSKSPPYNLWLHLRPSPTPTPPPNQPTSPWTSFEPFDPEPRALLAEISGTNCTQMNNLSTAGCFHFLAPFCGLRGLIRNGDKKTQHKTAAGIKKKWKARNLKRDNNCSLKDSPNSYECPLMHFTPTCTSTPAPFWPFESNCANLGGFILDDKRKKLPKNDIQHPKTNWRVGFVGSIFHPHYTLCFGGGVQNRCRGQWCYLVLIFWKRSWRVGLEFADCWRII